MRRSTRWRLEAPLSFDVAARISELDPIGPIDQWDDPERGIAVFCGTGDPPADVHIVRSMCPCRFRPWNGNTSTSRGCGRCLGEGVFYVWERGIPRQVLNDILQDLHDIEVHFENNETVTT